VSLRHISVSNLMRRSTVLFMPLILAALGAVPLVIFLPKLKSQISIFSGSSVDQTMAAATTGAPLGIPGEAKELAFPDRVELQNKSGSTLKAVLLGRSRTKISFLRESDRTEHIYAIRDLDPMSRKLIQAYPVTGLNIRQSAVAASKLSREELYIEQLREKNRALKKEIELLNLEANEHNQHDVKVRIESLQEQILKNELSILKREPSL
jgi:hypothetical protein